jgi:hypothetical protein
MTMQYDLNDENFIEYCRRNNHRRSYHKVIDSNNDDVISFKELTELAQVSHVGTVTDIQIVIDRWYSDTFINIYAYYYLEEQDFHTIMWPEYQKFINLKKNRELRKKQKAEAEYLAKVQKMNYERNLLEEYGPKI